MKTVRVVWPKNFRRKLNSVDQAVEAMSDLSTQSLEFKANHSASDVLREAANILLLSRRRRNGGVGGDR